MIETLEGVCTFALWLCALGMCGSVVKYGIIAGDRLSVIFGVFVALALIGVGLLLVI